MNFKLSKIKILIIFILLFLIGYLIHNIIFKPFPFFKVNYINKNNLFNSDPLNDLDFYDLKLEDSSNLFLPDSVKFEKVKNLGKFEKIQYATELTREIQEKSLGNQIKIYYNILSEESTFQEICSESSKIFLYLMHVLDERARILWLNGHTITEVWHENDWIFVDTSSNTLAFDKKLEKYSSFLNVLKSTNSIEFKPIIQTKHKLWDFRESPDRLYEILEENNLIVVLSNKNIFNFHTNKEKINRIFNSIFFNSNYEAKQFIHNSKTPKVGNIGIDFYKRIIY
jgi:hypothetical protein